MGHKSIVVRLGLDVEAGAEFKNKGQEGANT